MRDRLNYEKKLAHRARHKGSANKPAVTYESIINSSDLIQCHSVIKEEVRKSDITFLQKFTIPQLIVIGYGYNLSLKKRQGKPTIMKHLTSTILSAAGIANGTFKEQGINNVLQQKGPKLRKMKPTHILNAKNRMTPRKTAFTATCAAGGYIRNVPK